MQITTKELVALLRNSSGHLVNFTVLGKDGEDAPSPFAYLNFGLGERGQWKTADTDIEGWVVQCDLTRVIPDDIAMRTGIQTFYVHDQLVDYHSGGRCDFELHIRYPDGAPSALLLLSLNVKQFEKQLGLKLVLPPPSDHATVNTEDVFAHAFHIRIDREVEDNRHLDLVRWNEVGQGAAYYLEAHDQRWTIPHQPTKLYNTGRMDVFDLDGALVRVLVFQQVPFTPALLEECLAWERDLAKDDQPHSSEN